MTHFYTLDQLRCKNRKQLWKICDQIGCKRRKRNIDCVQEILSSQPQPTKPVEKDVAVIDYNDDSFEGLTQPYTITVNGLLINSTATYAQAERFCNFQGYQIADMKEQMQDDLTVYMEAQLVKIEEPLNDDYLFHHDPVQPRSTQAGTLPQQYNGYFELADKLSPIMFDLEDLRYIDIPKDVEYLDDWREKLSGALSLIQEVFNGLYSNGETSSDKSFLSKLLAM